MNSVESDPEKIIIRQIEETQRNLVHGLGRLWRIQPRTKRRVPNTNIRGLVDTSAPDGTKPSLRVRSQGGVFTFAVENFTGIFLPADERYVALSALSRGSFDFHPLNDFRLTAHRLDVTDPATLHPDDAFALTMGPDAQAPEQAGTLGPAYLDPVGLELGSKMVEAIQTGASPSVLQWVANKFRRRTA